MPVSFSSLVVAAGIISATAQAVDVSSSKGSLIVFGDSVSDNGMAPTYASGAKYFNGGCSNSYVWNEYSAKILNLSLENWAMSGATTDNSFVPAHGATQMIPSVKDTVAAYISNNTRASVAKKKSSVVAIDGGANDILLSSKQLASGQLGLSAFIQGVVDNQLRSVSKLLDAGYANIYVLSIPSMSILPIVPMVGLQGLASRITEGINTGITQGLSKIQRNRGPSSGGARFFDLGGAMNLLAQDASFQAMNVTNLTNPCLTSTSTCPDPDTHFFYDSAHMTGRPHYMIGILFANTVKDAKFTPDVNAVVSLARQYDVAHSDSLHNIVASAKQIRA
ncbi:hypothetical protein GQ54DRAFT_298138 [Martensiomyces pterosporus]|nr:hypothetical protein GQ54DRAFT_298138 [Martensiomyces pterosporus]